MISPLRLALPSIFLTLVLVLPANAAPSTDQRPKEISTKPTDKRQSWGANLIGYRNNSEKTLSFGYGEFAGTLVDESEIRSSQFFSISQTNYNQGMTAQDYGVELLLNGQVGAHLGFRRSLAWGSWYEPYYQYGVGALYKTSEGLGSFINYQRYQGRLDFGFEDLFRKARHFRLNLGLAYGPLGLTYQYSVAYVTSDSF